MRFFVLKVLMFFDFFHKRKILKVLKNLLGKSNKIIFDVGGHNGESIKFFNKYFKPCYFYTFEPLEKNFFILKKNTINIADKIKYFNFALGDKKEKKVIKEMFETSSSTLNDINENSNYFKKKKFFLGVKNNERMFVEKNIFIEKGTDIIKKFSINKVDLLKVDTEGYEYNVIKGFGEDIRKIELILFEHHYDLMIKKKYTFSDINRYLISRGFQLKHKFKMPFRKTFEYVYIK
ncbi:FkbM family methyltransferase [Alphaproteobacteria bacterium]|nr:FkbM family methyltransferase [Alphaproteobacteria bacterium]